MAKIKLTLINPNLENTKEDLIQYLKNAESQLKEEIYMTGEWERLGYMSVKDFCEDDYYSLVSKIANFLKS